ncbi:unnamed protein product [Prorocentrum cordatum]|uniref:Uncharacterized protein n=1 Tax=Prorocentrum cordatum TaxID=2364126 RepID=A0ABN9W4X3_9DINO|nr:unnamed protein product [Polarella glacialis]
MYPACYGQMLRGTHGLSVPARDPACPLTPDPFPSPEFIESDGLASGRVTPTCAVVSGRGQYQKSVRQHQHRAVPHAGAAGEAGRAHRTGYGYVSLRQAISAAVPPSPARPQATPAGGESGGEKEEVEKETEESSLCHRLRQPVGIADAGHASSCAGPQGAAATALPRGCLRREPGPPPRLQGCVQALQAQGGLHDGRGV